jgi:hypothetical protein
MIKELDKEGNWQQRSSLPADFQNFKTINEIIKQITKCLKKIPKNKFGEKRVSPSI